MKRSVQTAMRLGALAFVSPARAVWAARKSRAWNGTAKPRAAAHMRARHRYAIATAFTTYGTCGVKVWIFKGEIMEHDPFAHREAPGSEAKPAIVRPENASANAPPPRVKEKNHAVTQAHKVSQAVQGRIHGNAKAGTTLNFGAYA